MSLSHLPVHAEDPPLQPPGDGALDVLLLGAGLASCLLAWRLRQRRPQLRLALVEQAARLGGEHTWSFHDSDVDAEQLAWLAPLIAHRWAHQTVSFPGYQRSIAVGYNSITAARFDAHMRTVLGDALLLGQRIERVEAGGVQLADGRCLRARVILDGRGPHPDARLATGYQTFLGQELELAAPHGLSAPVIMDATVEQLDGYRFVYLLPFAANRLLVEDTYYNDHARIDIDTLRRRVQAYIAARGWQVRGVRREEHGVLPIVMAGDRHSLHGSGEAAEAAIPIGMRAGLFHAVTGYSLPCAVRLADALAASSDLSAAAVRQLVESHARRHWHEQGYFRLLTRMLFLAADPAGRRAVFERFYRLSPGLIQRFYAGRLHRGDKLRILVGKPPVPFGAALRVVPESAAWPLTGRR